MTLPWWNPFATERRMFYTQLSTAECLTRLQARQVDFTTLARSNAGPVYGRVGSKRFWLVRNKDWQPGGGPNRRSVSLFALRGMIAADRDGTRITMTAMVKPTILIITLISVLMLVVVSLIPLVAHTAPSYTWGMAILFDSVGCIIFISIYALGRWLAHGDDTYMVAYVRKLLAAQADA